jgi:carbonic anhydrase/acetyltransferase-like protein (isoleucine patch superfamily)
MIHAGAAFIGDIPLGIVPSLRPKSISMSILAYGRRQPQLGTDVYIAPGAWVIGDVAIGERSSIWFNSILRGDINRVVIGHHTNIQDLSLCHVADAQACVVGDYVTIGHRAILHGCTVGNEVLVGMGAVLMNGVVVGEQSIVGAAALLTEGLVVPPGSLVYGAPAKIISRLGEKERHEIKSWAEKYCRVAESYWMRA